MKSLEDILIEERLISPEQLKEARIKQIGAKTPIQDVILEMGFVEEEKLLAVVSRAYQLPVTDLDKETVDTSWTKAIPYELLKKHGVFPIRKEGDALLLAMSNPIDIVAEDAIRDKAKISVKPVLSSKSKIARAIETYYQAHETLYDLLKNIVSEEKVEFVKDDAGGTGYIEVAKDTEVPVTRLVNIMFSDAVKSRASDIHIEPQEGNFRVRYRIDGELRDIMKLPFTLQPALVNRIKVLAGLDIAEKRKTQDGRMKLSINSKKIDIRVSIIPVYHGEKAVLRILNPEEALFSLEQLGVNGAGMKMLKEAFSKSHGFVLVTGPTGSGKTTTLYAVLNCIKGENTNIITIEDPIEYLTEGINQIQVNPAKNVTFANGLRSILRQDPNVVLVGEIRDKETADIAFRASLTGHLILSTVHTNNAVATITRLRDLGLEAYIIASSLNIIIAQRLVKRVCSDCRAEYAPEQQLRDKFRQQLEDLKIGKFYKGKGCKKCDFSGWFGRKAIFEILKVDEKIKALITDNIAEDLIFKEAKQNGLITLAHAGLEEVKAGVTSLEEVARVVDVRDEEVKAAAEVAVEPSAPKPAASLPETLPDKSPEEKKEKILVVDDEEDIVRALRMRFKAAGYEVITAGNGEAGVEAAIKEKPDLIVMDVMMPKLDGFGATKEIRSRLETASIPIIMLTAKSDVESELKGVDAGADDYMAKPFEADRLIAHVKMLLKRKERNLK